MNDIRRVTVVGCGTIGLPCAVAFASRGGRVTGIDIDRERISRLSQGDIGRSDARLAQGLEAAIAAKTIAFGSSIDRASEPTAFVIAVQTPVDAEGNPEWRFLRAAADVVFASAQPGDLVILRSTVPVGATRRLADAARTRGLEIHVAACPDRSVSGDSFREQFTVPTIVGGVDAASARAAGELFGRLGPVVVVASAETAEAVKLFCNVQRDIQFAAANQFALACERLDLDFEEIRRAGAHEYPRFSLARPGPVGGDCLPKDGFLLAAALGGARDALPLALSARRLNQSLVDFVAAAICRRVEAVAPRPAKVAILGIAFKGEPATADQRHSFGVALAEVLKSRLQGVEISTWDPVLSSGAGVEAAVGAADAVVLANDHPTLGAIDLDRMAALLRTGALIYDACGRDGSGSARLANDVTFRSFGRRFASLEAV